MEFPIFQNEHYLMRDLSLADAADILEYCHDRELMKYTASPPHQSIKETEAMIVKLSASFLSGNGIAWAIVDNTQQKVIGNIGLYYSYNSKEKACVGYTIHKAYHNRGIATWTLCNAIQYGFDQMKLNRIEAKCKSVNLASERVMQKAGMVLEAITKSPFLVDGIYYDILTYAVTH